MVCDSELRLQIVAGPGSRLWRYAEHRVVPGRTLDMMPSPPEYAVLEPFYRSALTEPGTVEYHSEPTGLYFHVEAVPLMNHAGHVDQLLERGVDFAQGFYVGRPTPLANIIPAVRT